VPNSLTSTSGQRTYDHAIREFVAWYCSEPRLAFNRTVVLRYRIHLEQQGYAPATINLRIAAVRRITYEAADAGLLSPELAAGIRRVKGVRRIGVRLGNWLTPEQGRRLLDCTTPSSPRALRDHAMVAILIGCGLRARRAVDADARVDPAARGALGDCRSGRQGRTCANCPDSLLGEVRR
jgi:site-specific recombinase XerC